MLVNGMDSSGPNRGPVVGQNSGAGAYFVLGVFTGYFLVVPNIYIYIYIYIYIWCVFTGYFLVVRNTSAT